MTERDLPPSPDPERFKIYQSAFSYRYGSPQMKHIWSEENRGLKGRDVWIAVAGVQNEAGLVSQAEYDDLTAHRDEIDMQTIIDREFNEDDPKYTGHDILAAISEFSDKAPIGKRIIHQGMTSEDLLSNVETGLILESFEVVEKKLESVLAAFVDPIMKYKDMACMGYTHLQAAEPTTVGYRLSRYAQDFLTDLEDVRRMRDVVIKGKGIKGIVGTSTSFAHLLDGTDMTPEEHEKRVMERLGIDPVLISGQTYPRKYTFLTVTQLASIGQSAYQFATDSKILQSSPFGETAEGRSKKDRGSSYAMWKINPRHAETMKALTRGLAGKLVEAFWGAADVTLERGLEDSAGKRSYLPESFLIVDEALRRVERMIKGLQVREKRIQNNLSIYLPFFALAEIHSELQKRGADHSEMYEILAQHALAATEVVLDGEPNPVQELVTNDNKIRAFLSPYEINQYFTTIRPDIGDAPERSEKLVEEIRLKLTA